jgi:hypothetical protein
MSDIARRSVTGKALKAAFAITRAAPPPSAAWTKGAITALTGIAVFMRACLASPAHAAFFSLRRALKSHLQRLVYEVFAVSSRPASQPRSRFVLGAAA